MKDNFIILKVFHLL